MYSQDPSAFERLTIAAPPDRLAESLLSKYSNDIESPSFRNLPGAAPTEDELRSKEISKRLRAFRILLFSKNVTWGVLVNLLMYAMYIVVAVLLVVTVMDSNRSQVDRIIVVLWVAFGVWSMCIMSHFYLALGRRQYFAWGGFYVTLFTALFYLWTCASFLRTYIEYRDHENTHDEMKALLVSIAITIYLDQRVIEPKFRSLYCYYQGVTSQEELGLKPRISGISSEVLSKVAQNASRAIGLSWEQTNKIELALTDQSIRKSEDEALDDWTVALKQLTDVVSFVPFCRSRQWISSGDCHKLVSQMIIYLQTYMDTGKVEMNETSLKRSTPMTFGKTMSTMFKLSKQVPWWFILPANIALHRH